MLVFHWSQLTPTSCLFFIGHGLHPRNTCFSLVTAYTHAFLVSDNHFVDFIYGRMYRSTTSDGFISGQGNILHYPSARNAVSVFLDQQKELIRFGVYSTGTVCGIYSCLIYHIYNPSARAGYDTRSIFLSGVLQV